MNHLIPSIRIPRPQEVLDDYDKTRSEIETLRKLVVRHVVNNRLPEIKNFTDSIIISYEDVYESSPLFGEAAHSVVVRAIEEAVRDIFSCGWVVDLEEGYSFRIAVPYPQS